MRRTGGTKGTGERTSRISLVILAGAALSPFLIGVVTASAEELPAPLPDVVQEVVENVVDEIVPEAVVEEDVARAVAPEPSVVTIIPAELPIVDVDDAGPSVTVEAATETTDAEVVVTALPDGADTLAVLIAATDNTVPVAPLAITVTEPAADLDRPDVSVQTDAYGVVTGVTITPAFDGPSPLELDFWASADALSAPAVDVGDAGSALVRITLPTPAVEQPVAFTSPARGAGVPTVKLRALGTRGDVLQVTLVPEALPLPLPVPGAEPAPEPVVAAPAPVEPAPEPTIPEPAAAQPQPAEAAAEPAPTGAPAAPPSAPVVVAGDSPPPTAPANADRPAPGLQLPDSAPQVVTDLGRRSMDAARRFPIPTGLAIVVAAFVLVQGRIDRRDPRLAEGAGDDELLGFR